MTYFPEFEKEGRVERRFRSEGEKRTFNLLKSDRHLVEEAWVLEGTTDGSGLLFLKSTVDTNLAKWSRVAR